MEIIESIGVTGYIRYIIENLFCYFEIETAQSAFPTVAQYDN